MLWTVLIAVSLAGSPRVFPPDGSFVEGTAGCGVSFEDTSMPSTLTWRDLVIEPAAMGRIELDRKKIRFDPNPPLPIDSEYTCRVDALGLEWTFRTLAPPIRGPVGTVPGPSTLRFGDAAKILQGEMAASVVMDGPIVYGRYLLTFEEPATIGEVNDLLRRYDATILRSLTGTHPMVELSVPVKDAEDGTRVWRELEAESIVKIATPEMVMGLH